VDLREMPKEATLNAPTTPARRLFFALWPDDAARSHLADAVRNVVSTGGGLPVPHQNLHVTLAYLGATPESRMAEIMSVAQRAADTFPVDADPLRINFDRIEYWQQPQILCATTDSQPLHATNSFNSLAEGLKREARTAGFTPDVQPSRAHVTLAREIRHADGAPTMEPVLWTFTEFALVDSRNPVSGPQYTVIGKWRFARS
jgi:RNA 2',3'-cyclic 3'-phosphodiesterase